MAPRIPGGSLLRPELTALDVRSDAAYWARFAAGVRGTRLLGWGRVERDPEEGLDALLERLHAAGLGRRPVDLALRSPELEHRRLPLPGVSYREAGAVGARRAAELARELPGETACAFLRGRTAEGIALWLCGAPIGLATLQQERWQSKGFDVAGLRSHHLALGNLTALLPPAEGGTLTAILDLEPEHGTCVVTDAHGWLFSRQIPLKFAGEKRLHLGGDEDEDDGDPIEVGYTQAERITTELERTLRYVQSVLALGQVGRVVLTGETGDLRELGSALTVNLEIPATPLDEAIAEGPAAGAHPGAAVALGLGLTRDSDGGDLLPDHAREARLRRTAGLRLRRALVGTATVCACGAALWFWGVHALSARIGEMDREWRTGDAQRVEAARASAARERARSLSAALAALEPPEPGFSAALETLGRLAPDDALVEQLTVSRGADGWRAALVVEARAETVSAAAVAVSTLARSLDESPLFALERVERKPLPRGGLQPVPESARVRFSLDLHLAPVEGGERADPMRVTGDGRPGRPDRPSGDSRG